MKKSILITLLIGIIALPNLFAQKVMDRPKPDAVVKEFFEYFHDRDTTRMAAMMLDHPMTSIIQGKKPNIQTSSVKDFLNGMASLPEDFEFEEKILEYKVYADEAMAVVTTPYIFHLNGNKTHAGTNVFILAWIDGSWKISHVTDSRIYE